MSDILIGLTLSEIELRAIILALKEQRDALPLGDPARYDFQAAIYERNQDLIFLRHSKRRR